MHAISEPLTRLCITYRSYILYWPFVDTLTDCGHGTPGDQGTIVYFSASSVHTLDVTLPSENQSEDVAAIDDEHAFNVGVKHLQEMTE